MIHDDDQADKRGVLSSSWLLLLLLDCHVVVVFSRQSSLDRLLVSFMAAFAHNEGSWQ